MTTSKNPSDEKAHARKILFEMNPKEISTLERELVCFRNQECYAFTNQCIESFRRHPNKEDLLKAEIRKHYELSPESRKDNIFLMELLKHRSYPEDLEKKLEDLLKFISSADLSRYDIIRSSGNGYQTSNTENVSVIYSDSVYQFILRNNFEFIAFLGFDPEDRGISIRQIQGISGKKQDLEPIKWSRLLLSAITSWAKKYKIPEITLQSYIDNQWHTVSRNLNRNSQFIYDISAQREGFVYDEKRELYVKKISQDNKEKPVGEK